MCLKLKLKIIKKNYLNFKALRGIYVRFDSPPIIKYLELLMGDVFTARFDDCHLNETNFSTLG